MSLMPAKTMMLMLCSGALMVLLHLKLDATIHADELLARRLRFLPSVGAVHLVAGGMDKLAADLYWLQFVQYCGEGGAKRGAAYDRAYDYLNLITGLDPQFTKPYWFGCWNIGYWQKRPDLADKILQRGIAANPTAWDLAGINEDIFDKNPKKAARYYRMASKKPGAPDFLERHAQILESNIPELTKQFQTLWTMYWRSRDANLKASLYKELIPVMKRQQAAYPNQLNKDQVQVLMERLTNDYNQNAAS
jgi:hypothetical protein